MRRIKSFWKWNVGERLVIYLAIADFGFSSSHLIDKGYIFRHIAMPPDPICAAVGFLYQEFFFSQMFIVLCTALGACSLIVFNKKLNFGRWDWRLLAMRLWDSDGRWSCGPASRVTRTIRSLVICN